MNQENKTNSNMRKNNTVYVRKRKNITGYPKYKYEAFIKCKGEGAIVGGITREDAIFAGNVMIWGINTFGVQGYKLQRNLVEHADLPKSFNYEVIDDE